MFIWIDKELYPHLQNSFHTTFCEKDGYSFAVVAFKKAYKLKKKAKSISVSLFADNKYFLYVNGKYIGTGPVCPGGDYGNTKPMPVQYYSTYELEAEEKLEFYVLVQLTPTVQTDISCGRGILWLDGKITYEDGTVEAIQSNESWECRKEMRYISEFDIDFTQDESLWQNATECESIWNLKKSPIKNLFEERIEPASIEVDASGDIYAEFDKIYAGYVVIGVKKQGLFNITITTYEVRGRDASVYKLTGENELKFRSIHLDSVGGVKIQGLEMDDICDLYISYSHYPSSQRGEFSCDDEVLNKIYAVGRHTTEICRQTIELDSPMHQENLGCTGDYYISSLISYFCFGDTSLSAFDILRTAEYLCMNDGKMFHTSYSLIWVQMLYDNYMFSGDKGILEKCKKALMLLLERFEGYVGDCGVIDNAPDYMFIDWIYIDKYNLHHPPMALGQTALNAFYYKALCVAEKIYSALDMPKDGEKCHKKAEMLKINFNKCFFDKEKGLYRGGMNNQYQKSDWLPENTEKVYYLKHANILAVLYDLCEDKTEIIEKIRMDETPIQPYFMHFYLEAIYQAGLFGKYGIAEMYKWKSAVDECDKGMKEAWEIFPGYGFDYSHAWGATVTYQLMSKLSGIEIKEAGFRKISIKPNSYGLRNVYIKIPTSYGYIECHMSDKTEIKIPEQIKVTDA